MLNLLRRTSHTSQAFRLIIRAVSYTHLDVYKRQRVRLGLLEFSQQMLLADVVDEVILGTDIMNAYGFVVDLRMS